MNPRLVLAAHGSTDPRFATVVEAIADGVRRARPGLDVRVGYLDHGPPSVTDLATADSVVVPLLLTRGFHALVDIPRQVPGVRIAAAVGPDPRLAEAVADRLRDAGYDGSRHVVLAGAGSSDPAARADVRSVADALAGRLGAEVDVAFVSAGEPRLADITPEVVGSYLLAPGAFADAVAGCGATVVGAPIGDHPVVAEIALDRYDAARG